MATYGEIRFRLAKMAPGVDLDVLDGLIQDRYEEILDRLSWDRKQITSTLQTEAEYSTGNVTATEGLATITGDTGVWTAAHTGRMIRIAEDVEFYGFTRDGDTSGTLERSYEGATITGSYRLNRNIYMLPSDVRKVHSVESFASDAQLHKLTLAELNQIAPRRDSYGSPYYWAPYMDSVTDPPVLQIELYPVPIEVEGFRYTADTDTARPTWSSASLLPWVRPAALVQGVMADISRLNDKPVMAVEYERRFAALMSDMVTIASRRAGPVQMRSSDWVSDHEIRRYTR